MVLDRLVKVKVKKLHPDAILPKQAHEGDACWDVSIVERVRFWTHKVTRVRTGLAFEVPPGYFLDIRPRSGVAEDGLVIVNSPGTLDSKYRGEFLILAMHRWSNLFIVEVGDRIVQIRLAPVISIEWIEVTELTSTERGEGGFGSTGR